MESKKYSYSCVCVSKTGVLLVVKISDLIKRMTENKSPEILERIREKRSYRS